MRLFMAESVKSICVAFHIWMLLNFVFVEGRPVEENIGASTQVLENQRLPPENVDDGQSMQEKLEVMKILQEIEINTERKHGLKLNNLPLSNNYLYQGDIVLSPSQAQALKDSSAGRQKRKLIANLAERWQLPIQYSLDTRYSSNESMLIDFALKEWERVTCITFKEVNYSYGMPIDEPIVQFVRGEGCWSSVGRNSSTTQKLSIGSGCFVVGVIAHEIGHVIGFWHEQSRPDRDEHVKINFDNVQYGNAGNFQVQSWQNVDNKDIPYDVGSIMHYGSKAYTREGKRTIETRDPLMQHTIGQREAMSFYDVKLANIAYCQDVCDAAKLKSECLHDGYQNPKDCTRCLCPDGLTGRYCETVAPPWPYEANCGRVINVGSDVTNIETPGFPGGYFYGQRCNWLFKAPEGNNIYLHFTDTFLQYDGCGNPDTDVCRDYVEVKYYNNMAGTGARLCCSKTPNSIIRSHSNMMLVLFRALGNGTLGFRASVSTESCGGCATLSPITQKPCLRRVSYTCAKTWKRKAMKQCSWWTDNCGYSIFVNKVRYGTCFREEPYCCDGFTLLNNKCSDSNTPTQTTNVVVSPSSSNQDVSPSTVQVSTEGLGIWMEWSVWGSCSRGCGGCGTQTRTRACSIPKSCSGKTEDTEIRPCNATPCTNITIVQHCVKTVEEEYFCNPWTLQKCTRQITKMALCTSECCVGYIRKADQCILEPT